MDAHDEPCTEYCYDKLKKEFNNDLLVGVTVTSVGLILGFAFLIYKIATAHVQSI